MSHRRKRKYVAMEGLMELGGEVCSGLIPDVSNELPQLIARVLLVVTFAEKGVLDQE
jgi:hypothetical protein